MRILQKVANALGYRFYNTAFLPKGVDWLLDVQRLSLACAPAVVLDVGANHGQTTLAIKERFPGAEIHAFEPVQATFERLCENTACLRGVVRVKAAVGNTSGRALMAVADCDCTSHLVRGGEAPSDSQTLEEVSLLSLADYCCKAGLAKVDLLKTDTEGHDLEVLEGMFHLPLEKQPEFVLSEVAFANRATQTSFRAANDLLTAAGYQFYGLYNYWHKANGEILYCDALWVRLKANSAVD